MIRKKLFFLTQFWLFYQDIVKLYRALNFNKPLLR